MVIEPVVAGKFYPGDPEVLKKTILSMLAQTKDKKDFPTPKALISPHAGYIYSGPIAASAYAALIKDKDKIKRVVVLAPSHQYPIHGLATTNAESYRTPLGEINIDQNTISKLSFPFLQISDKAFSYEHSLEVQLPFLQVVLEDFKLIPILVGHASIDQVEEVLESVWGGPETIIVISSDLSHYHPYTQAQRMDQTTAEEILNLNPEGFTNENACGGAGIKGLLAIARKKNMAAKLIDLRNSGDTQGPRDGVVGYGAFHFL